MTVDPVPVFDFVVARGDSLTIELGPVTTRKHDGTSEAEDLTLAGTKMWVTIKESVDDVDPGVAQVTEAGGITLNSPVVAAKNMATAFFGEASFSDVDDFAKRKELVWDAVFERGTRRERIARGKIVVVPSVTRAT